MDRLSEKRLIDAEALKKAVRMWPRTKQPVLFYIGTVLKGIEEAPTVDAVEVVRCKDCACYEETCPGYGYCYHWDYEQGMSPNQVEADDFCSCGERRT